MLDFESVRAKTTTIAQLAEKITLDDLRRFTNEMVDTQLEAIANAQDADVVFVPVDPQANDKYAAAEAEINLPWTLGHIIVHTTASSEEAAFIAAEMARGIAPHERSRYEMPWQGTTTIAQCRQRLAESRRMRLASLDVWPAEPHLEIIFEYPNTTLGAMNPIARFAMGLMHDDSHINQIKEIMRQAQAARLSTVQG